MSFNFIVTIGALAATDNNIVITSDIKNPRCNPQGKSIYALESMLLNYSILNSSAPGVLFLSSNYAITEQNKIKCGQIVLIHKILKDGQTLNTLYIGFVKAVRYTIGIDGISVAVSLDSLISQLMQLPMIYSSQDNAYYGVSVLGVLSYKIKQEKLWIGLANNSLLKLASTYSDEYNNLKYPPFNIINGTTKLPDTLWANVKLNQSRDSVIREILTPYNRIMFQDQLGIINVQPLFINDKDSNWDINLDQNVRGKAIWERVEISDNSGFMINKIIESFAFPMANEVITEFDNLPDSVQVAVTPNKTYFKRLNELNRSGYYNTGIYANKALSKNMLADSDFLTYFEKMGNNGEVVGIDGKKYPLAELYAQNTMALNLINANSISIAYEYTSVQDFTLPLAKIINVTSKQAYLEHPNHICYGAVFRYNSQDDGASIVLQLSNLYSITGIWDERK